MECPNCQNEIPANAVFCGEYGHKLEQPARPSPSKPVSIQETTPPLQQYPVSSPALAKAHKGVPGWVWGLGGALGVVLTGVCALAFVPLLAPSSPATQVVTQTSVPVPAPTQAQPLALPTDEVPPTPTPTQNPWYVVMDENFSNSNALDTAPDSKIEGGELLMGGRYPQALTTVQGDFRLSYDYQWLKLNPGGDCRYDAGGFILTYSHSPDPDENGNDSDRHLYFSILDQDKRFAAGICDNIRGESTMIHDDLYAGSILPNEENHVQVESKDGLVALSVNGEVLADDIEYPAQGFIHELYLDSSGDSLGCNSVEVKIDNVVIEEYR